MNQQIITRLKDSLLFDFTKIHCIQCVKKLSNIYETSSIHLGAFKKVTTPVTLREGDTYMGLWTRSYLVPEMAYKLCGAMP